MHRNNAICKMKQKLLDIFIYVKSSFYGNSFSKKKLTASEDTLLDNFLEKTKGWDINTYWNFILFSFERRSKQRTLYNINLSWIFGDKALKCWKSRDDFWDYYVNKFKVKYRLINPYNNDCYIITDNYREEQRLKYFNSPKGYLYCRSFGGVLFDGLCETCSICEYKNVCESGEFS